ncbi:hypothetical protein PR002_g30894 [Phytophthora rubi]|nr:hypothetical protein PR002_g30894 [Phytophthora rubi]
MGIVHCSFLVSSHGLSDSLGLIAERIIAELEFEAENGTLPENDGGVDEQGATQHEDTRTAPLTNRGDAVEDAPVTRSQAGDGQEAAVEMLRGRGQTRWQPPMPELLQVETAGHIVERASDAYVITPDDTCEKHKVEYSTGPGRQAGRRWLTEAEFEHLEDAAKVVDDLGAGDGL